MAIRKLPVGIQSFEDIRNSGYLYVDKTKYIWDLVQMGKVYFLSRPRRFGKSLLISTMEAYFQGRKDLFKGLAMEQLEDTRGEAAWREYPVIRFSLSGGEYNGPDGLEKILRDTIRRCAERYGLPDRYEREEQYISQRDILPVLFINLIEQLHAKTGRQVVVLVDEYDKPLLETMIINPEQEEQNRQLYKSFFSVLKDEDQYLKFVFFTGVTKFSKVSVFSDLNQLDDISLDEEMAGLCGITQEEMLENFEVEIKTLAKKQRLSYEECIYRLEQMYDGYHFSPDGVGVYNPFSLLQAFRKKNFGSYWFESGTPTFLIRKLMASNLTVEQLTNGVKAKESVLRSYRTESKDPIPLFYQAGYLTICNYDPEFRIYTLKFPNNEVKFGFLDSLLPYVLGEQESDNPMASRNMIVALRKGDIDTFMSLLESVFATIPYYEGEQRSYEQEWRNEVFLILIMLGINARSEVHTSTGRVDCIIESKEYIYLFEFKLDRTADEALAQIEEKGYALPYKADPRTLVKIGVNFSSEKRNIEEWKREL